LDLSEKLETALHGTIWIRNWWAASSRNWSLTLTASHVRFEGLHLGKRTRDTPQAAGSQIPAPDNKPRRVIEVVARKGDEAAALELAKSKGYGISEESDDLIIIMLICGTPGRPVRQFEPYIRAL
jgi:hypothetical protein